MINIWCAFALMLLTANLAGNVGLKIGEERGRKKYQATKKYRKVGYREQSH